MNQWRPFDIKSFLKASRHWDEDIKRLQEEHDNLSVLPAQGDVPSGKTGNVSDITAGAALRRLQIVSLIEQIELNKEILDFAFRTLTEDERRLIEGFYYPKKTIAVFVQEYGHNYGMGRSLVYKERDRIEQRMARAIEHRYYD